MYYKYMYSAVSQYRFAYQLALTTYALPTAANETAASYIDESILVVGQPYGAASPTLTAMTILVCPGGGV